MSEQAGSLLPIKLEGRVPRPVGEFFQFDVQMSGVRYIACGEWIPGYGAKFVSCRLREGKRETRYGNVRTRIREAVVAEVDRIKNAER